MTGSAPSHQSRIRSVCSLAGCHGNGVGRAAVFRGWRGWPVYQEDPPRREGDPMPSCPCAYWYCHNRPLSHSLSCAVEGLQVPMARVHCVHLPLTIAFSISQSKGDPWFTIRIGTSAECLSHIFFANEKNKEEVVSGCLSCLQQCVVFLVEIGWYGDRMLLFSFICKYVAWDSL